MLWSCLLQIGMLLVVKYTNGAWIGHGSPPMRVWTTALVVPACDLLLAVDILRHTHNFRLARPLFYVAPLLAAFAVVTFWMWKG